MHALRDLSHDELTRFVTDELGAPRFRADQIFQWIHGRGATSFDEMTDLSRDLRARLASIATLETIVVDEVQTARDGTRKLRLLARGGGTIESVLIPDGDKL